MARLTRPVNWNRIEDPIDLAVWNRLTQNFWLPEKIPVSGDIPGWERMSEDDKKTTLHVFTGLTMLDTIQATVGAVSLIPDSVTQHEEAIYTYIAMQESVHAKSYSNIFSTLCSTQQIDEAFRWSEENQYLQSKADTILKYYDGDDPLKRKIASTFLESFSFYSGFYWPFYLSSRGILTNSADIIRMIVVEESIHGYYIGYKFQVAYNKLSEREKAEVRDFAYSLLSDLYRNELRYTTELYPDAKIAADVKTFLRYNANKALMNLGFDPLFDKEETQVSATIISALSTDKSENHDFFSGSGSSYVMAKTELTDDEDWSF